MVVKIKGAIIMTTWAEVKEKYENSLLVCEDLHDPKTGKCTFDIEGENLSVAGRVIKGEIEDVFEVDDDAIVYDGRA
jgi:hypothetical protein